MKIYICPECGQFREASRRKEVICYRCENEVQMQPIKLIVFYSQFLCDKQK